MLIHVLQYNIIIHIASAIHYVLLIIIKLRCCFDLFLNHTILCLPFYCSIAASSMSYNLLSLSRPSKNLSFLSGLFVLQLAYFHVHLSTARTNSDGTTDRLENQRYFLGIYCIYCNITNCAKTMACGVAINSLEIYWFSNRLVATSKSTGPVEIGARARGNRNEKWQVCLISVLYHEKIANILKKTSKLIFSLFTCP